MATLTEELERLVATSDEQVRAEIRRVAGGAELSRLLQALAEDPRGGLRRLAAAFSRYWVAVLAPHWPRLQEVLDADLGYRARCLTAGGSESLFADLHPAIRWSERRLAIDLLSEDVVDLAGRGLVLVPSVLFWQRPMAVVEPPWQPTLAYPARGIGLLWDSPHAGSAEALAGVLGRTRSELLALPRTTTELAARLGLAPGGVSAHLSALSRAGLVASQREGRRVLYQRMAP